VSRSLRYAVLIPLAILAFALEFVVPHPGWELPLRSGVLIAACVVWYLLWATMRMPASASRGDAAAPVSPAEQRAWVGLLFTAAILVFYALRGGEMVAADGTMAPAASAIGRHIGTLVLVWLVVMRVLRRRWHDTVDEDERDRAIHARACGWARSALSVFVFGVALAFAFSPLDRLGWARPMMLSNLMMVGLVATSLVEYTATGLSYWRDRHRA
jgi:hypothetical protein